ncbi:MAG: hypothetical protein AAF401_15300 [Pseudomonadota bacterium]
MIRVAIALMLMAFPAMADDRPHLLCGGNEPFWSLELDIEEATYTAPDSPQIDYTMPHVAKAEGRNWPRVLTLLATQDTALAILRPMQCDDTMSDREYDWTIDLLTQRRGEAIALTGCCRLRPAQ